MKGGLMKQMAFKPRMKPKAVEEPQLPQMPTPPVRTESSIQQIKREVQQQPEESSLEEVWSVQKIATQTESVIYNSETGETLDVLSALVRILNILESE